jgi:hydrogenase maturation protease
MSVLILGIGNLLLGDEGVGVHAVRSLAQSTLPEGVQAVEAGTAFLEVLPLLESADAIVVVDAMEGGGAPGSVYRVPFDECKHPELLASLHGFDLSRVLYMAGNARKPEVVVFGVEPEKIEWGMDLSPVVQRSVPKLCELILAEAETLLRKSVPAK